MKLYFQYLRARIAHIALLFAFFLIFLVSFFLYRLPLRAVLYPAALCLLLGILFAVFDFLKMKQRLLELKKLKGADHGLPDTLPPAHGPEAAVWREIAAGQSDARRHELARAEQDFRNMTDYYTLWVHQIKTPIAAMRLKLQEEDTALARSLRSDLGRIERYVEMVMTYLRLNTDSTDYVIRQYALDGILRPVFRQFSGEFILRKLSLRYEPTDEKVLTDEKWLAFVLGQLISNALKYTREGEISVYMEAPGTLCIRDTGIGIAPEDLPRVFEESYTGETGRKDHRASGIGLYLCRRICDRLGHGLSIESEVGKGTTVRIDLSRRVLPIE
ncbi:MAG: sensor histidine kinase [Clostridia bacterium]|nr:sensor histidine kinase [Clostridia bacterium]